MTPETFRIILIVVDLVLFLGLIISIVMIAVDGVFFDVIIGEKDSCLPEYWFILGDESAMDNEFLKTSSKMNTSLKTMGLITEGNPVGAPAVFELNKNMTRANFDQFLKDMRFMENGKDSGYWVVFISEEIGGTAPIVLVQTKTKHTKPYKICGGDGGLPCSVLESGLMIGVSKNMPVDGNKNKYCSSAVAPPETKKTPNFKIR